jgi:hypothetical protein
VFACKHWRWKPEHMSHSSWSVHFGFYAEFG